MRGEFNLTAIVSEMCRLSLELSVFDLARHNAPKFSIYRALPVVLQLFRGENEKKLTWNGSLNVESPQLTRHFSWVYVFFRAGQTQNFSLAFAYFFFLKVSFSFSFSFRFWLQLADYSFFRRSDSLWRRWKGNDTVTSQVLVLCQGRFVRDVIVGHSKQIGHETWNEFRWVHNYTFIGTRRNEKLLNHIFVSLNLGHSPLNSSGKFKISHEKNSRCNSQFDSLTVKAAPYALCALFHDSKFVVF